MGGFFSFFVFPINLTYFPLGQEPELATSMPQENIVTTKSRASVQASKSKALRELKAMKTCGNAWQGFLPCNQNRFSGLWGLGQLEVESTMNRQKRFLRKETMHSEVYLDSILALGKTVLMIHIQRRPVFRFLSSGKYLEQKR